MTLKIEDLCLIIQTEGGVIQDICSNSMLPIRYYIIDFDNEGVDSDELRVTAAGEHFVGYQGETRSDEAYINAVFNSSTAKE